ncbi:MAG: hypothetical protein J6X49_02080 [Victivallales bacterium]|nr:hypothetical protein [Victivallales bacterium]
MNKNLRLTQQAANAISGYLEAVKQMTGLSYTQIISQRLQADLSRDPFGLGGRWSKKASERRAARRAERKAAEASASAKPPQQEPQEPEPDPQAWKEEPWAKELIPLRVKELRRLEAAGDQDGVRRMIAETQAVADEESARRQYDRLKLKEVI